MNMNRLELNNVLSENWQKYALVDRNIKVELCDEQVKDVSIETRENVVLSQQYTTFTEVSETASIKKEQLQPQLTVCIEKLPVVTKAEENTNVDQLNDYLLDGENCDQFLIEETENEVNFSLKSHVKFEPNTSEREVDELFSQHQNSKFRVNITGEEYFYKTEYLIPEEVNFKSEDEGNGQSSTKSSAVESKKGLHSTSEAIHMNDFCQINTNNSCAKLEVPSVFKCHKCSYQTHQKRSMSTHLFRHVSKCIQCPHCPYLSNYKSNLKQHELIHIPKQDAELHKCPKCCFTSKRSSALSQHMIIHKEPYEITWYHCRQCPFKTKHKSNLKHHMIIYSKEDQLLYKCALCFYKSLRKSDFQIHLQQAHRPKSTPPMKCPEEGCFYETHIQKYLANHIRRSHKNETFFKCSKCSYGTKYAENFRRHQIVHDNPDKRFLCPLCPYRTARRDDLNQHALVHQTGDDIKWFTCSQCSFRSKRKHELKVHKVAHVSEAEKITDWFHCYLCTWRAPRKQSLARHIRAKHTDADGRICGDL